MKKIRVLIVDDAVVVRRMVSELLAEDPSFEVAAAASTGRIALAKIPQVNPDLITLDVEMPDMDGLQTLKEIRKTYPRLPVIMFGTQTERGSATTLDALGLGATGYVTKPADMRSVASARERIREELIPKIKLLCGRAARLETPETTLGSSLLSASTNGREGGRGSERPLEIVAIGSSTGGPNALAQLLPALPADFPVPIVIAQHMPPGFTQSLAQRLASHSAVSIGEAMSGGRLAPGQVWIAPGNYHMEVCRDALGGKVRLHQGPPENSCRPAVDVLFRSVAECYGASSLAVVLTGMGYDGLRGCEALRQKGGQILAQDEASSVVWGMPGSVAQAGLADRVLPLDQISQEILRRIEKLRPLACERAQVRRR